MRTIYVVGGTRGEWSDTTEWIVCAYTDKEVADKHEARLTAEAERLEGADAPARYYPGKYGVSRGDRYWVVETELRTELPAEEP